MRLKNSSARVIGFGRILTTMPGSEHELSETTFQQLRRDPLIRHLIVDGAIKTIPKDLFDLTEDPHELQETDPVPMPSRRGGGILAARQGAAQLARKVAAKRAADAFDDDDFDDDGAPSTVAAVAAKAIASTVVVPVENVDPVDDFCAKLDDDKLAWIETTENVELLALIYKRSQVDKSISEKVIAAIKARGDFLTKRK